MKKKYNYLASCQENSFIICKKNPHNKISPTSSSLSSSSPYQQLGTQTKCRSNKMRHIIIIQNIKLEMKKVKKRMTKATNKIHLIKMLSLLLCGGYASACRPHISVVIYLQRKMWNIEALDWLKFIYEWHQNIVGSFYFFHLDQHTPPMTWDTGRP